MNPTSNPNLAGGDVHAHEARGLATEGGEHEARLAILGEVDHVALLAVREDHEVAPLRVLAVAHAHLG